MITTPPPPMDKQLTIADLERLAGKLALTPNEEKPDDDDYSSVNAQRIMYRFWLRTDNEQELALMQYLDILRKNKKLQPFIRMALRAAILECKEYYDHADPLFVEIEEMFTKIDWSKD